ncbi:ECF-type sigma factor [Planctellipticum variicoloris]|uniref:ECF-type sigma factor n=1 Tax=Planctellipticum variicoloris TaxID=3064265 RepID=UPI002B6F9982|nr:ECF-type sigma factor [Planctomycetaceae bacterium SH412]HTN03472.1 ECF-type sigma factor [Planctomycetaceae bacterium]
MATSDSRITSGDSVSTSITLLLNSLRQEDAEAMRQLWDRYFASLAALAEKKIRGTPVRGSDGEDIAASVMESLWNGARKGRFIDVRNRDELWWLLLALTQRKVASHLRSEQAAKRGGGSRRLSLDEPVGRDGGLLKDLIAVPPQESDLIAINDTIQHWVGQIVDPRTREIAVLTLQGSTAEEIAAEVDVAVATVRRKLRVLRQRWAEELDR